MSSVFAIGMPKREPVAMRKSQAMAIAKPPPTARPSTIATVRHRQAFERLDAGVDAALVGDAVVAAAAAEGAELLDVGACDESDAARPEMPSSRELDREADAG